MNCTGSGRRGGGRRGTGATSCGSSVCSMTPDVQPRHRRPQRGPPAPVPAPPPHPGGPAALCEALVAAPDTGGVFREASDLAGDLGLDGQSLSILENIYPYSRSRAYQRRIFIVRKL